MDEKLYAVIDAAILDDELFTLLEQEDPPSTCLYSEPLDPDLAKVAPYLVQVTPVVKNWLDKESTVPWGYYLTANETLVNLRRHLKKYLQVNIPAEEKPVFLRFYDPRVIWNFMAILDDWTLHQFMGPVVKIITLYQGEQENSFHSIRKQFPKDSKSYRSMLTLTAEQYATLQQQELDKFRRELQVIFRTPYEQQKTQKIVGSIAKFDLGIDKNTVNQQFARLSEDYIEFCQRYNIDEASARILATCIAKNGINDIAQIPGSWHKRLSNKFQPQDYNIKVLTTLLQQEKKVR